MRALLTIVVQGQEKHRNVKHLDTPQSTEYVAFSVTLLYIAEYIDY